MLGTNLLFSVCWEQTTASAIQKSKRDNKTTTEASRRHSVYKVIVPNALAGVSRLEKIQRTNIWHKMTDLRVVETGGALQLEQREDSGRGVLEWWGGRSWGLPHCLGRLRALARLRHHPERPPSIGPLHISVTDTLSYWDAHLFLIRALSSRRLVAHLRYT